MKCNRTVVSALLLLISVCPSLSARGTPETASLGTQQAEPASTKTSTLSRYRELAEAAYREFQKGDYETAARTSGLLEMLWDSSQVTLKVQSRDIRVATDAAMDRFIDPLKSYREKAPDPKAVQSAYEAYISQLNKTDWALVSDRSLNVLRTASGVLCIKVKQGNGRQPRLGDIVVLRSTGLLEDGKEFRHTPEDGSPGWYWLLPGRQPLGLIEAMNLLHVGDSAVIVIPASLGYGPNGGFKDAVPPDAPLTYVVDLLDVKSREIDDILSNTIQTKGIDAAVAEYLDLQKQGFPDIYVDEQQINSFGYEFLKKNDTAAAIKILTLNMQTFPHSANVYDSLGEAYAKNGDKDKATENYQKALAIDPKMESSIKALDELQGH